MDVISPDQVRCPTCRALQEWSNVCRRCRCDLRLLRSACSGNREHRRGCILQLEIGRPDLAMSHALRCHELQPGADSLRLLALCILGRQDWETALELVQKASYRGVGWWCWWCGRFEEVCWWLGIMWRCV